MPPENAAISSPPDHAPAEVAAPLPAFLRPPRRRSHWRWRLRWGRPLPWPTRVEILATLGLWLLGSLGWERWQANRSALAPFAQLPRPTPAAQELARPIVTDAGPDKEGFYTYRNDRLEVRVPVPLRLASRSEERPDLSRARGQRPALKFELNRVFDFRARSADAADLAHDFAAQICRAASVELLNAEDEARSVNDQPAVHTVLHARLPDGRALVIEGLTIDEGAVAWSLWAGYPEKDERAAAAVRASFASATLRPLAGNNDPAKGHLSANF